MTAESLTFGAVLIAGILSFLSPCVVPLLPVYLSVLSSPASAETARRRRAALVLRTLLFVGGISVCFIILGFGAGALGSVIDSDAFMVVLGAIVVLLGLHQTGWIKLKFLNREETLTIKRSERRDALGVFLLGLAFSFGWTPCVGPVLAAILGLAAGGGAALQGAGLMAVYALGFSVPFLVLALFSEVLLAKIKRLNRWLPKIKTIGGVLIILMGVLLMTNQLHALSAWIGG